MNITFPLINKSSSLISLYHYKLMMTLTKFSPISAQQHQDNSSQDHRTYKTLLYLSHQISFLLNSLLEFLILCRVLLLSKTFPVPTLTNLPQFPQKFPYQQEGQPEVTKSLLICRTMSALMHKHLCVIWLLYPLNT